jgi:hypothetical protein
VSAPNAIRVQLADIPGESRTTTSLLASLAARLGTLHFLSGSTAVGSLISGVAVLGIQVSKTIEGARMRRALEASRLSANGERLWKDLRIEEWMTTVPATPVLDQMRNDFALLLATDVDESLELMPVPAPMAGSGGVYEPLNVTFLDYVVGLWAFSRELAVLLDAIAAPTAPKETILAAPDNGSAGNSWLR